jgi:hypothetical protein
MMGSFTYHIERQVEQARAEGAPQDAIYKDSKDGHWHRLGEVTNPDTRWHFKRHHPELIARFTDWEKGETEAC